MSISNCLELISAIDDKVDKSVLAINQVVLPTVKAALKTLVDLASVYLNLARAANTLSGSERQGLTFGD